MKTLPATSLYLVALTGAALWLSACGSVIDPDEDGGSAVEPDDHNGTLLPLEDRVADGVRSAAQQFIDDGDIAGMSVMVMQPDSGDIYREHFGLADIEAKTPMADDTLFRLASMTKPIVSAAVMMLVEDGELALDDPIATYLPEWAEIAVLTADDLSDPDSPYTTAPAAGDITVHQLLTHTSGITYAFYGGLMGRLYRDAGITDGFEHSFYTTDIQSETLAGIPLAFEPGTAYSYGLSIDILGRLIEAVSGQNLEDFLRQRLFEPLGMEDTHFRLPPAKLERLAPLYRKEDGSSIERVLADGLTNYEGGPRLPAALYAADFAYNGFRTYLSGGAGLISTTD
ncbi:MAG: serine hydrolase domain-containing protein, partial [Myxococcota bacterium]